MTVGKVPYHSCRKLKYVSLQELPAGRYWLYGSGNAAKTLLNQFTRMSHISINGIVERHDLLQGRKIQELSGHSIKTLAEGSGAVILSAVNIHYQYNQLSALENFTQYDEIYFIDPYASERVHRTPDAQTSILLFENAIGVTGHHHWTKNLIRYLNERGADVEIQSPLNLRAITERPVGQVILWNGQSKLFTALRKCLADLQISPTYMEVGFFPQENFFYLDRSGVNQTSALMQDPLDWIEASHLDKIQRVRDTFLPGFVRTGKKYILVPLQVGTDTNVINCSSFKNGMQDFIDFICAKYGASAKLLFKEHPKDPARGTYNFYGHQFSDRPFTQLLENAACVHGITSSTLYEAVLAGLEVIAEGESLLNRHAGKQQQLLAAMIDRQVSIEIRNFDYWINRYSHIILP